jgi:hypothetical protein
VDYKSITNAFEADRVLPRPIESQVWAYARRSQPQRLGKSPDGTTKSIADQMKINKRTADQVGLPWSDECLLKERPGLGGDVWWDGVMLGNELDGCREMRPQFSRLRDLIRSGECKCVVVYSQCRLFRDVGIANAFMDLCVTFGVRVYDKNGLIDIWSSDGRAYVRHLANQNQTQREKSVDETARGIQSCWDSNELVTMAGRLGFRSGGYRTKVVRAIPEEIAWVRLIFKAFVEGIDERGPLSMNRIAQFLTDDPGFSWTQDLVEQRGARQDVTRGLVYTWQVRNCLKDVRYRGQQMRGGVVGYCPAFLVDGQPVIDERTFDLAQKKLASHKGKHAGRGNSLDYPFAGLVRCGICGQRLKQGWTSVGASRSKAWTRYAPSGDFRCEHYVPPILIDELRRYFLDHLAPLVASELETRESAQSLARMLSEHDSLLQEEREIVAWIATDLPAYAEKVSPSLAAAMESGKIARLERIRRRIAELSGLVEKDAKVARNLNSLPDLSPALVNDLIDQVVQWVAVVPYGDPAPRDGRRGPRPTDFYVARLLFCLTLGVYHTVLVCRRRRDDGRTADIFLVPADEAQVMGTICDLPFAAEFLAQLMRSSLIAKVAFNSELLAPAVDEPCLTAALDMCKWSPAQMNGRAKTP